MLGRDFSVCKVYGNEKVKLLALKTANYCLLLPLLAGLSRLMGHRAVTVCMVVANRLMQEANTNYKNSIDTLIQLVLDRI